MLLGLFHNIWAIFITWYGRRGQGDLDTTYEESYQIRLREARQGSCWRGDNNDAEQYESTCLYYMKKGEHDAAMECFSTAVREERLAILRYEQALKEGSRRMDAVGRERYMKVVDTLYNMKMVYANTGE